MSTEAIGAIDADLARVAAAQLHLAAAHAQDTPTGQAEPGEVQHGHAVVASAEAELAAAEAALNADQANQTSNDPSAPNDRATDSAPPPPVGSHFVDVTA